MSTLVCISCSQEIEAKKLWFCSFPERYPVLLVVPLAQVGHHSGVRSGGGRWVECQTPVHGHSVSEDHQLAGERTAQLAWPAAAGSLQHPSVSQAQVSGPHHTPLQQCQLSCGGALSWCPTSSNLEEPLHNSYMPFSEKWTETMNLTIGAEKQHKDDISSQVGSCWNILIECNSKIITVQAVFQRGQYSTGNINNTVPLWLTFYFCDDWKVANWKSHVRDNQKTTQRTSWALTLNLAIHSRLDSTSSMKWGPDLFFALLWVSYVQQSYCLGHNSIMQA